MLFDLQKIIQKADQCVKKGCDSDRQYKCRICADKNKGADQYRNNDADAAHRRDARFFQMRLRPVFTDLLAEFQFFQDRNKNRDQNDPHNKADS